MDNIQSHRQVHVKNNFSTNNLAEIQELNESRNSYNNNLMYHPNRPTGVEIIA